MRTDSDIFNAWFDDPVVFAEDCFDIVSWSRQAEFTRAVAKYPRVAIRSGHKTGKSTGLIYLALWWAAIHEGTVIYLSPEKQQIKENLYNDTIRFAGMLHDLGLGPISESIDPDHGLMWPNKNRIFGVTANTRKKESRAGFSGKLMYVLDEASGISDDIIKIALTAPNAKVIMASNPTRNEGYFYDVFHDNQKGSIWHKIHLSSREVAKEQALHPDRYMYLANNEWVASMVESEGEGSYHVNVRVDGNFSETSDVSLISLGLVNEATARWSEYGYQKQTGQVYIGVDPARFGSDKTAIVWRIGQWASTPLLFSKLSADQVADEVRSLADKVRGLTGFREKIVVNIDASNANSVSDWLKGRFVPKDKQDFIVQEVCSAATAEDDRFAQVRCELWHGVKEWLRLGGQIPFDSRMMAELKATKYRYNRAGRMQVQSKDDMKAILHRSPDSSDALALTLVRSKKRSYTF